jgi:CheY-specific phosphatase CheX
MNHPSELNLASVSEWLTQAVQDVSETMFGQAGYPADLPVDSAPAGNLLVACIGIRGNFQLEVAMYFPQSLAGSLASLSLEMPAAQLDEKMVNDVAGEFSNMVVGAVKSRVSDLEVSCSMTVPRVVRSTLDAQESAQKVQAALAVIRGSAGPRKQASPGPSRLAFHVGEGLLLVDVYL